MPTRIAKLAPDFRLSSCRRVAAPAAWFTLAALTAVPAAAADDTAGGAAGASVAMASLLGRVTASTPALRDTAAEIDPGAGTASPSDAVADAQGRVADGLSRLTVSRWVGRGPARLGLGFGAVGYRMPGVTATATAGAALANPSPAVTVGLQLDLAPRATMYADASSAAAWRNTGDAGASAALYNTRVGMEFKSANTARGLGFDRGAIGLQLDSGYRLQMKPRRGGLAFYLRGQF